jgi:hypothetical protein
VAINYSYYPHPEKVVPYDAQSFSNKLCANGSGKTWGARGRCRWHAEFPAVVMQRRGKVWETYCEHCLAMGRRVSEQIEGHRAQKP